MKGAKKDKKNGKDGGGVVAAVTKHGAGKFSYVGWASHGVQDPLESLHADDLPIQLVLTRSVTKPKQSRQRVRLRRIRRIVTSGPVSRLATHKRPYKWQYRAVARPRCGLVDVLCHKRYT